MSSSSESHGTYENMTSDTALPVELLPCPFCGGEKLEFYYGDIEGWIAHVRCIECDDMIGPMSEFKYESKEEAADDAAVKWNTRALSATRPIVWEPIETAPKDGTKVLVGRFTKGIAADERNGVVAVDYWHSRDHHDFEGWGRFNSNYWPATHWQPLPALPITTEGE